MPKRRVYILDREESPWRTFLDEFFTDTLTEAQGFENVADFNREIAKNPPDIVFVKDSFLTEPVIQKLRVERESRPGFRVFKIQEEGERGQSPLGQANSKGTVPFDGTFTEPLIFIQFQQRLTDRLPFPETLQLLFVDDEPEITRTLQDYLAARSAPAFQIRKALNGAEGLKAIEESRPDLVVMDVKMPVMNGIELYREIRRRGLDFPVVVYFDAVFGDEVTELHKIGSPAIVEKGAHESSVSEMVSLILKMAYFA